MMKVRILVGVVLLLASSPALADTLKSNNFEFDESFVGGGGLNNESSPNFQAGEAIGDLTTGTSTSTSYDFENGFYTTAEPSLAFAITNGNANFGLLSPGTAATANATFDVTNYTSYGYVVTVLGGAPQNEGHSLPGLSSPTPSQVGTEQYGMNVVANSSPITFGANPDNTTHGNGAAYGNYAIANNYTYVQGDTIASAPKSSGLTHYTASYIINVSSLTRGGTYTANETLVCTGTY